MYPKPSAINNTRNFTFYADITSTNKSTTICYVMVCVRLCSNTLNYFIRTNYETKAQ